MESTQSPGVYTPRERRGGSIVGPAILILVGALFLGQSLGWLPSTIWSTLLSYWPVLLILIGAELILGRGSWVGALVLAVALIGLVSLFTFVGAFPWSSSGIAANWPSTRAAAVNVGPFVPVETTSMVEPIDQTERASYRLEFGAGSLSVSALPAGSTSLLEATLERDERATINRNVVRRGDLTAATIEGRSVDSVRWGGTSGRTRMAVQLSPLIAGELRVNGGAGELNLDLSTVPLTYVEVNAGVGGSKVALPQSAGRTSATINVGVGGVDVTVPEGVAARITVDKGIGGVDVDGARFPKVGGDTYQSANYSSAENRVDLYVSGGIGGITVR